MREAEDRGRERGSRNGEGGEKQTQKQVTTNKKNIETQREAERERENASNRFKETQKCRQKKRSMYTQRTHTDNVKGDRGGEAKARDRHLKRDMRGDGKIELIQENTYLK